MKKYNTTVDHGTDTLAEDARELVAATANVAQETVAEARERLAAALEKGKEVWVRAQDKAREGARTADHSIRQHPYQALGVAFGVGALLGFLITRRR